MRSATAYEISLGLILLAGTALRLYRLGADSLWYDETVSTYLAGSRLPELLRHTAGDIHPPGYYVLLRGWLVLMGYPTGHADAHGIGLEFAAAFLSLFFGVLLIALVYALARRVANHRVGLIAALLVALSPYNVWYSQEVRMYTLGAALGVMVVYALLQIGQGTGDRGQGSGVRDQKTGDRRQVAGWWAVYAVAAAAGMYTLYYFVFLLIPLNLWVLWQIANGKWQTANSKSQPPRPAPLGSPATSRRLPASSFQPGSLPISPPYCYTHRGFRSHTGRPRTRPSRLGALRLTCGSAARELDRTQPGPVGTELALARAAADDGPVRAGAACPLANGRSPVADGKRPSSFAIRHSSFILHPSSFILGPHRYPRPACADPARFAGDAALPCALPVHLQPGVLRGDGCRPGMAAAPLEGRVCSGAWRLAGRGGSDAATRTGTTRPIAPTIIGPRCATCANTGALVTSCWSTPAGPTPR